jgi:hypothetical protein
MKFIAAKEPTLTNFEFFTYVMYIALRTISKNFAFWPFVMRKMHRKARTRTPSSAVPQIEIKRLKIDLVMLG